MGWNKEEIIELMNDVAIQEAIDLEIKYNAMSISKGILKIVMCES
jgi:hypothetical protein